MKFLPKSEKNCGIEQQFQRYRKESETKLRHTDFFDMESHRTNIFQIIFDRRESNKFIPKNF